MSWLGLVALVVLPLLLLGVGYLLVSLLAGGGSDGAVLPSHYSVERYASGGTATEPDRVGICEECGVWTDPDAGFCPICTGVVREVVRDRAERTAAGGPRGAHDR